MAAKTNASRLLDTLRIPHEVREYEVDEADLSAPSVARKVGLPSAQVFKTLVVKGEPGGHCFALVAADEELDLKALAKARGDRKAALVALKDVQPLTGYVRGGVTVLGAKRAFPVVIDARFVDFESVAVSAGIRGAQLVLAPRDYVDAVAAKLAPIGR